jgi:chromosome segregation ATPase
MTDEQVTLIIASLSRLEDGQTAMRSEIAELRAGQDQLRAVQDQLRADIAQMRTDIARLQLGQDRLRADVDSIRADVASLRADVDSIRADIDTIRADQAKLREHVDRLRADVMERIDRLQNALTLAGGDISVNFGSSDQALRIAKAAQDSIFGVHEILSAMQRRIGMLQSQIDQLRDGGKAA